MVGEPRRLLRATRRREVAILHGLKSVEDGDLSPIELREKSLLGSPTILRVLAGAYHLLAVDSTDEDKPVATEDGREKARLLFEKLAPQMGLPISDGWFDTGFFPEPTSKAPSSRTQDLRGLTALLAKWGETERCSSSR